MRNVKILIASSCLAAWLGTVVTGYSQGTAFTYQGCLNVSGIQTSGSYDMRFTLFTTNIAGSAAAGPVTNLATAVSNGLFTASVDFGANVFSGTNYWIDIAVRTNAGTSFVDLSPRQLLTPVPYAIYANSASNLLGVLPSAQLPNNVVVNNESGVTLSGTFSGNGSGLVNTVTSGNYVSAYDTTSHTISSANTFQNISFAACSLSGWTYFGGVSDTFTCPQSGTYLIQYSAEVATTISSATTITLRVFNYSIGVETIGSESTVTLSNANQPVVVTKSVLAPLSNGNLMQIQFSGSNTSAELVGGVGAATTNPSITCTIIRIQ